MKQIPFARGVGLGISVGVALGMAMHKGRSLNIKSPSFQAVS